jgi:hypothetical protein
VSVGVVVGVERGGSNNMISVDVTMAKYFEKNQSILTTMMKYILLLNSLWV